MLGYQATHRMAVGLSAASTVYKYRAVGRARKRGLEGLYPTLEYRVQERVTLSAGAGLALDMPVFYDIRGSGVDERRMSPGMGIMMAAAYTLRPREHWSTDVQARFHAGRQRIPTGPQTGGAFSVLLGVQR